MSILNFDPASPASMLWLVANNANSDDEWFNSEEWKAIDKWRVEQHYGMYVRAIDMLPNVFTYITNPETTPLRHMTTDQLRALEVWYTTYIVPIKEMDK